MQPSAAEIEREAVAAQRPSAAANAVARLQHANDQPGACESTGRRNAGRAGPDYHNIDVSHAAVIEDACAAVNGRPSATRLYDTKKRSVRCPGKKK
jgi:hypothetical protein